MFRLIYITTLLVLSFALNARAGDMSPSLVGIYSDMARHQESGDVIGTEIIISKTKSGYFAVIQTSEGSPCKPVVAPVVIEGVDIKINIPTDDCYSGLLSGVAKSDGLMLSFGDGALSPRGEKKFLLPRRNSFWTQH
jgi:hypothetical protein